MADSLTPAAQALIAKKVLAHIASLDADEFHSVVFDERMEDADSVAAAPDAARAGAAAADVGTPLSPSIEHIVQSRPSAPFSP